MVLLIFPICHPFWWPVTCQLTGRYFVGILSEQQLHDGGWRIPFVIGGIAAILSLLARSRLEETLSHQDSERKESGSLRELFKKHWKTFY